MEAYEIRLGGELDEKWAVYFVPFKVITGVGETLLIGSVHDQAELFGILLKIRDSGLHLISVMPGTDK